MTDLASVDFFSDPAVSRSPYEYWDYLREQGPVTREPHHGVVAVTGYREGMAGLQDHGVLLGGQRHRRARSSAALHSRRR